MDRNSVKAVQDECASALAQRGFERPRQGTIVRRISDDFFGWVGLNKLNTAESIRINPFVGVHCIPIMKQIASLRGDRYQQGQFATYAIHLGEICPDAPQFMFEHSEGFSNEAERMALIIEEFGVPWMSSISIIEELLPLLRSRIDLLGGYPQRLASGLAIAGKKKEARELINRRSDIFLENDSIRVGFTDAFLKQLEAW